MLLRSGPLYRVPAAQPEVRQSDLRKDCEVQSTRLKCIDQRHRVKIVRSKSQLLRVTLSAGRINLHLVHEVAGARREQVTRIARYLRVSDSEIVRRKRSLPFMPPNAVSALGLATQRACSFQPRAAAIQCSGFHCKEFVTFFLQEP